MSQPAFVDILYDTHWKPCQAYGDKLRSNFEQLIIVGVGGSRLGAEAFHDLCGVTNTLLFSNLCPVNFKKQFQKIKWEKCHFLFISKSGETLETVKLAEIFLDELQSRGLKAKERVTVIGDKGPSYLMEKAHQKGVTVFYIPKRLGGRFSVFSPVGLIPMAFWGIKVEPIREALVKENEQKVKTQELIHFFDKNLNPNILIVNTWVYGTPLIGFGKWLCQLWCESLGKNTTTTGEAVDYFPIMKLCYGGDDQHSYAQQNLAFAPKMLNLCFVIKNIDLESYRNLIINNNNYGKGLKKNKHAESLIALTEANALKLSSVFKQLNGSSKLIPIIQCPKELSIKIFSFFTLIHNVAVKNHMDPFNQPMVQVLKY